jgi:hypothetical protein
LGQVGRSISKRLESVAYHFRAMHAADQLQFRRIDHLRFIGASQSSPMMLLGQLSGSPKFPVPSKYFPVLLLGNFAGRL